MEEKKVEKGNKKETEKGKEKNKNTKDNKSDKKDKKVEKVKKENEDGVLGTEIGLPIDRPNCESTGVAGVSTPIGGFISQAQYNNRKQFMSELQAKYGELRPAMIIEDKDKKEKIQSIGDKKEKEKKEKEHYNKIQKAMRDAIIAHRTIICPKCKSINVNIHDNGSVFHCVDCGYEWSVYDYDDDGKNDDLETRKEIAKDLKERDSKKDSATKEFEDSKKNNKKDTKKKAEKEEQVENVVETDEMSKGLIDKYKKEETDDSENYGDEEYDDGEVEESYSYSTVGKRKVIESFVNEGFKGNQSFVFLRFKTDDIQDAMIFTTMREYNKLKRVFNQQGRHYKEIECEILPPNKIEDVNGINSGVNGYYPVYCNDIDHMRNKLGIKNRFVDTDNKRGLGEYGKIGYGYIVYKE